MSRRGTRPSGGVHPPAALTLLTFNALGFNSLRQICEHITKIIEEATDQTELTFLQLQPKRLEDILKELEELLECHKARISYNSLLKKLCIRIMPTPIHGCHLDWFCNVLFDLSMTGVLSRDEYHHLHKAASPRKYFTTGPYAGSVKEPDFQLKPDALPFPTVVVESGWSESETRLQEDMNLWLVGASGGVKAVILINWARIGRSSKVRGTVDVYVRDRNGMPIRQQHADIFPIPASEQRLHIKRELLFGNTVFPGRDPKEELDLFLPLLRKAAELSIAEMGLEPA